MKSILYGNSAVSIGDAIYISIVSMLIVFFILILISFVLSFFKYFPNEEKTNEKSDKTSVNNNNKVFPKTENDKKFDMGKIKDDTMLAAMMAALIEAAEDNENSYIKVKNVREIK